MTEPVHPIALENIVFLKTIVQAIPEHEPIEGADIARPENSINIEKIEGKERSYAATMHTVINREMSKSSPYFIEMQAIAVLHADNSLSEEEAARGVSITAHSVLFGAIREAVAWLTGRQPYGPVILGLSILRPRQATGGATQSESD